MAHTRKHRREQRLSGETKKNKLKVTPKKGTKIFGVDVTKGGLAGGFNRARKRLKKATKEDLTLFKNKNKVNKVDPKQFDNRRLKISDEAKQDLKDQSSDKFGGKLPKQKLKIKPSKEAKQDLKDQASDKFGGKLPNKKKVEKKEVKKNSLDKYRRTKEEGVGKGDTRITKGLKKAGFTETRLARLRKKNAEFQKAKKGGKEAMKAYRKKYPKRG